MDTINALIGLTALIHITFILGKICTHTWKEITISFNDISYQQPLGYKPKKIPKDKLLNSRPKKRKLELLVIAWFLIIVFILLLILAPKVASAAIPEQYTEAGQLLFKDSSHNYHPSLHQKTEVNVDISGMIATTRLQQTFKNTTNQWLEGIYVFPLPENASITHLTIIINDRKIVAEIKEKSVAKKIYNQAKSEGKKAAIIEQHRTNIFRQAIANIGPQEQINVELIFYQTVKYDNGYFEYHLPTTITPRYTTPHSTGEKSHSIQHETNPEQKTNTLNLSQGWNNALSNIQYTDNSTFSSSNDDSPLNNPIKITIDLNPGLELADINGLYHDIKTERKNNRYKITTKEIWQDMNRDFVLHWQPVNASSPSIAVFNETFNHENYGLLMLMPPTEKIQKINRSVTFIIDTSGSMGGTSIKQAKSALVLALRRLKAGDKFNIIEFNSNTRPLFSSARHASQDNLSTAITFVNRLNAGGGTEMKPALKAALTAKTQDEKRLKQIVFMTDGSVTNEQELLQLIHQHLNDARLFTIAIGSAPNRYFMNKAAQFGRGTSIQIGNINEVQNKIFELFAKLENATLQNIHIDWPSDIDAWPQKIGDLYINEPIIIAYKERQKNSHGPTADIHGYYGDGKLWQQTVTINNPSTSRSSPGISKVWARFKIDSLMDQIVTGTPESAIKPSVINLALEHSLVSQYTSLVAVETEISRPLESPTITKNIPLTRPQGQTVVSVPQTDTPKALHIVLGVLLLIFGITFSRLNESQRYA